MEDGRFGRDSAARFGPGDADLRKKSGLDLKGNGADECKYYGKAIVCLEMSVQNEYSFAVNQTKKVGSGGEAAITLRFN
jgi:hypothetical protein